MLTREEAKRLESHVVGILRSVVLPEITAEGCILTRDADGRVTPDRVATHHLVELCLELDNQLCRDVIQRASEWFAKGPVSSQDPFAMTTLARAGFLTTENRTTIRDQLLASQLPSGFIDLYAGFLDGGSIFSTLWAVRILREVSNDAASRKATAKALSAIRSHWDDVHRTSFKGYYLELASHGGALPRPASFLGRVLREILKDQGADGMWDGDALYTAYVLGNLSQRPLLRQAAVGKRVAMAFRSLFGLETECTGVPAVIAEVAKHRGEAPYLQVAMRSTLSAIRHLKAAHGLDVSGRVAAAVLGAYPGTYQSALALGTRLKEMDGQYGGIHRRFAHLEVGISPILTESPYEKNVFVMMPFRQSRDERYEAIEKVIRAELKKHGLRAWLASDKTLAPQLWDNVASFLLACKFGIAVFTRIERDSRIEEEFNPNVSLELGFCLSRGRDVLILKDSALKKMQTDLVGHLYEEFDLNQVNRQLPRILRRWTRSLGDRHKGVGS
ncbi:MAG: hypothetical protein K1Y01_17235 [Vicinamibacteria bacterium]|nr:hypothetical protein [Vicinamibacteria bacterium]